MKLGQARSAVRVVGHQSRMERRGGSRVSALVILPTYNELGNLRPLVEDILAQSNEFHVLVIDDGSPDGTGILADHLHEIYPERVAVIHREGKLGLATAYLAGFHWGISKGYDFLFEMDADFSHRPEYLPRFLETARSTGADVVLGSRYVPGGGAVNWSWHRELISRAGSWYAGKLLGLPFRDLTGGFKLFRREALQAIDLTSVQSTGYGFQIEMTFRLHRAGMKIVEYPIVFHDRRAGESKMSPGIFIEAFWMVAKLSVTARGTQTQEGLERQRVRP
jgi:dolichol-phosphate mannosyltransferase